MQNKVALSKQNYITANNGYCETDNIEEQLPKNRCDENRKAYNVQRNLYVSLVTKANLDYYKKLDLNKVSDNKIFWKTCNAILYG